MDKQRLFFGVEMPEASKSRLLSVQQPVKGARWQSPEQLHLTLVFLGNVQASQLKAVQSVAQRLSVEPFTLTLLGLGCFGEPEHPKVLWAGIEPSESLDDLQNTLSRHLVSCGFRGETRRFQPHITLARFRQPSGSVRSLLAAYREYAFGSMPVSFLSLFESQLTPEGASYSVLDRIPLSDR